MRSPPRPAPQKRFPAPLLGFPMLHVRGEVVAGEIVAIVDVEFSQKISCCPGAVLDVEDAQDGFAAAFGVRVELFEFLDVVDLLGGDFAFSISRLFCGVASSISTPFFCLQHQASHYNHMIKNGFIEGA